jgi:WD40 repeat protein
MAVTPERWRRIEDLFSRAVERSGAERATFVREACGDDFELADEVYSLLAATENAQAALRGTIARTAATLDGGRIGPYRIVALIGEGGMGAVYLAARDDAEYRGRVAIKVLRAGLATPDAVARFRDERQVLAALAHPGIVRLLDGGHTDDGLPYLVMEHVNGAPLAAHACTLSVRGRAELVIRLAEALQYAHQKLVVHRDVKPSNVLVDRDGAPKLLDFGIAKLLDPEAEREAQTRTGTAAFTIEYASPEQVRGEPVSVATDVYSVGAVLYHLLVGSPPQRAGATPIETLENICQRDPLRPSLAAPAALRRELAGDLDNIVLRALQKSPEQRYASAAALADDLRRYLAGLPVAARAATFAYRARKLLARHRGKLAVSVMFAAALITSTVVSLLEASRADRQAGRAEAERRTLLVERGRQELTAGHAGRALPYLAAALRAGADTAAVRVLIGAAMRPYQNLVATMPADDGDGGAAWSPDGARIAITSMRGHGRLFDRDGRLVARLDGEDATAYQPIFSSDSTLLAIADDAGRVQVWRATNGERRLALAASTEPAAVGLAFVDGHARLATVAADHRLSLWETVSGARVASLDVGCPMRSIAVTRDGTTLATSCEDGSLGLFDAHTLALRTRLEGHRGYVRSLAFSPDGTRLFSVSADGTVRMWDVTHASSLATLRAGIFELAPDGLRLLVSGDDSIGRIYDVSTATVLAELVGHDFGGLRAAHWSHDGTTVATSGVDATFRLWDAATGESRTVIDTTAGAGSAPGSPPGALDATFSADDTQLLTLSGTGASLWRSDHGALVTEVATGGELWSAAWSPNEQRIAIAGLSRGGVWKGATAQAVFPIDGGSWMYDVNWSPDGTRLVIAGKPNVARVFAADGTAVFALTGHTATVNRAAFSPDGGLLATASSDGTARIWDAATGSPFRVLTHPDRVMAAGWSRDGTRLVTASTDHHLRVWVVATGALAADLDGGDVEYLDVTFSPDGRALAAAGHGGEAEAWDLDTRRRRLALVGNTLNATNAVWDPDGALIATTSSDHTARVWDASTGALLETFRHPGEVMSLQWSRDGTRILTGCHDGGARVWAVRRFTGTSAELDAFIAERVHYARVPW